MTVCAKRNQVFFRVYFIFFANFGQRLHMMYLNVLMTKFAILLLKIKTAGMTLMAKVLNALTPGCIISFIGVGLNLAALTFGKFFY